VVEILVESPAPGRRHREGAATSHALGPVLRAVDKHETVAVDVDRHRDLLERIARGEDLSMRPLLD
jgi:hypothetical protein